MNTWLNDTDVRLYLGNVEAVLAELPERSVQCVVTSPPYYGLRDYGSDEQIGLEPTPGEYVDRLVSVFRSVRRVLRDDGTVWINLGDSYNAHPGGDGDRGGRSITGTQGTGDQPQYRKGHGLSKTKTLKPKDLLMIPARVALALQSDGWYLRSDVIWSKPNCMPESVSDRPTQSHEHVFLLTKNPRYYYDADAVREAYETKTAPGRRIQETTHYSADNGGNTGLTDHLHAVKDRLTADRVPQSETLDESLPPEAPRGPDGRRNTHVEAGDGSIQPRDGDRWPGTGRNMRNVWTISPQPTPEAHFATFPEALVRRCIAAGTSEAGECSACGVPWERQVDRQSSQPTTVAGRRAAGAVDRPIGHVGAVTGGAAMVRTSVVTTGWAASCACGGREVVPQTCLDPFVGSGTTALVARKMGRHAIGIDLNESYLGIAARRLGQQSLFA